MPASFCYMAGCLSPARMVYVRAQLLCGLTVSRGDSSAHPGQPHMERLHSLHYQYHGHFVPELLSKP